MEHFVAIQGEKLKNFLPSKGTRRPGETLNGDVAYMFVKSSYPQVQEWSLLEQN